MRSLPSLLAATLVAMAFAGSLPASAQPAAGKEPVKAASSGGILSLLPGPATSEHRIEVGGKALSYTAEAATLSLLGGDGKTTAEVFSVAYTRKAEGGEPPRARPITFVFNGGPGAASAYLQLGAIGPRTLVTSETGEFLPAPQRLEDNPDTWLDFTDLVFVDPVGTGYSRAAPGKEEKEFWSVDEDASSVGAFIRLYLLKAGRTGSPLFLAGESYGGFRAALLAKVLQEDVGLQPSGIVMISPVIEFSLLNGDDFAPLTWALPLPAMAAVHFESEGLTGEALKAKLSEVERYALSDYMTALASGLEAGRDAASDKVAAYTGLPLDLVRRNFARITPSLFIKESEREGGEILSRYDGSVGTADLEPQSSRTGTPDPLLDRSVPVLTQAFVAYARDELGFDTPISYRLLNREVSRNWDFGTRPTNQGYAGVLEDLQEARSLNPALGVLIAHGYGDLVTPYPVSRYLVGQLPPLKGAKPIATAVYEGGHMMYFRASSRRALKADAEKLYP